MTFAAFAAGGSSTVPPAPDEYVPGICNIGPAEIA